MKLVCDDGVKRLGIVNPVACIISKIKIIKDSSALDEDIDQVNDLLKAKSGEILKNPQASAFQELFANIGYENQTPSGERLMYDIMRSGLPRHNNVVDTCNLVSAMYATKIGMHDSSDIHHNVNVQQAIGYEALAVSDQHRIQIKKGDLVYSIHGPCESGGIRIISSIGSGLDSDDFKVTAETSSLLIVVLGNSATSQNYNRDLCLKVFELIQKTCSDAKINFLHVQTTESSIMLNEIPKVL